jgi:hypothetical protein
VVERPFRSTSFNLGILYGFGTATGPRLDSSGNEVGTADYSFGAFAQTFDFEYRLAEWISATAGVITSLYSGMTPSSVVNVGAQIDAGLGVAFKLGHRFGPVEASFSMDAAATPAFGILVGTALSKAIKEGVIDPYSSFESRHAVTVNAIFSGSIAPWPAFGLTANLGYVHQSLKVSGEDIANGGAILFAAAADFDFGKISSAPIGVTTSFRTIQPLEDKSGVTSITDVVGGLFYTAQRDLALVFEVGWRSFVIREPLDSSVLAIQIRLQYYW